MSSLQYRFAQAQQDVNSLAEPSRASIPGNHVVTSRYYQTKHALLYMRALLHSLAPRSAHISLHPL